MRNTARGRWFWVGGRGGGVGGGVEIVDILFYCIRLQIKNVYVCMWILCDGDIQWKSWVEVCY